MSNLEKQRPPGLKLGMDREHPAAGGRAFWLAAALLAITLNFLQPLVHAALARGGPTTAATWKSLCLPSGEDNDAHNRPGEPHACCLGLAQAPTLPAPPASFVAVRLGGIVVARPAVAADALAPVGIRDGPPQPHGPPSLS